MLLVGVLVAIAVLYWLSRQNRLHQTFFVYQASLTVGSKHFGDIGPVPIMTTLVGVLLSLWWGGIESSIKRVQPFIAMANAPVPLPKGAALSYQSSYSFWAASRASRKGHWLLASLSFGSFLAQIRMSESLTGPMILAYLVSDYLLICCLATRLRKRTTNIASWPTA